MSPGGGKAPRVREAADADVERLLPMCEWLFESPGYRPPAWDLERACAALAGAIASPDAAVLVADDSGRGLVGLCTAYIDLDSVRYGRRCWVEDLTVAPGRRSEGIGRALLEAAREWAKGRGATHLELDTGLAREEAQRFYDRERPAAKGISYSWML